MNVKFFPGSRLQKTGLIAGFLTRYHVDHELVRPEDFQENAKTFRLGTDPAVEVDGEMFVDPNVDALRKILHLEVDDRASRR